MTAFNPTIPQCNVYSLLSDFEKSITLMVWELEAFYKMFTSAVGSGHQINILLKPPMNIVVSNPQNSKFSCKIVLYYKIITLKIKISVNFLKLPFFGFFILVILSHAHSSTICNH